MKRKSNFIILLCSTAITIGTLFATLGKPFYMKNHNYQKPCMTERNCHTEEVEHLK